MKQLMMLGSPVQCRDGKGGTLKEIVVDPRAEPPRVDYLVVHRGFLRGHDHCVPAGNIQDLSADGVTIALSTDDLQSLSDVEATIPGQSYSHRCVPEHCLVLDTGTRIIDTVGSSVGQLQGVVIGPDRAVVRILLAQTDAQGVPVAAITEWREQALTVQPLQHGATA